MQLMFADRLTRPPKRRYSLSEVVRPSDNGHQFQPVALRQAAGGDRVALRVRQCAMSCLTPGLERDSASSRERHSLGPRSCSTLQRRTQGPEF